MEPIEQSGGEPRSVVETWIVEVVVALCVLALGITVIAGSWKLGSGWTSDGPGAGYFPFYIGIVMCIAGVGIIVQTMFTRSRNTESFVDEEQLKRVLSVFLPALVYIGAVQLLGLYVASAIYIALFMIILGKYSAVKSVIVAFIVNAIFFGMFEVWFKVPLFKGQFDLLSFLGY